MIADITNAAVASNQVGVSTVDPSGVIIDGPTNSATFTLTQVQNVMIAPNAVTTTKIADNSVDSNKIRDGRVTGADIQVGVALNGSISADSPTFKIDSANHRVGIGTTTPEGKLNVMGGDIVVGHVPFIPFADSHSLFITNDGLGTDPMDSFRIDASDNNLYIIADSHNGATAGAGIIFRTAKAGYHEPDVVAIRPDGYLVPYNGLYLPNSATALTYSLILKSQDGTCHGVYVTNNGTLGSLALTCPP